MKIIIELIEEGREILLARTELMIERDILKSKTLEKADIPMHVKGKGLHNVRIKLSMRVTSDSDLEKGLLASSMEGVHADTKFLLEQQIRKAGEKKLNVSRSNTDSSDHEPISELQRLKNACAGPLGWFEGFGATRQIYCGVRGPPDSRGWMLGIYSDKDDFDRRGQEIKEIDLRRILSIGGDPGRTDVFAVTYLDKNRDKQRITFRTIDINREVWLEMLRNLIQMTTEVKHPTQPKKSRSMHR
eukprot:CAMPEP_0169077694 /NCGR_PEP_ID=MMETSP1015-20121227/9017_1 /TAXON_ID=342587 /ORGANISM="Karlodinium micrum, Strain CCMP2283" /LENGTH=243 /DNA_ID=CAMNT_0009137239 /DNA_START=239 /DNA_END=970 /DNA_ORIENTATION=+